MEDEHPDTDIVKEKDELNTKSEDSVSSAWMTLDLIQEMSTNHVAIIFSTNQISELNLSQNYLPVENELHSADVQLKQIVS
jgi:hypothetical protein